MKLRAFLGLLPVLGASAAVAEDHLMPLDLGLAHYRDKAAEKWFDTMQQDSRIVVEFDVFHAFRSVEFLGILESPDRKTYTLQYFVDDYDPKKAIDQKVDVPADFAQSVMEKTDHIIRLDTRYDAKGDEHAHILDGDEYMFRSEFAMGQAFRGDDHDVPGALLSVFRQVVKLSSIPASEEAKRKDLMDVILNDLDAIKVPE